MNTNAKHSPAPWRIDGETIRADNGWEVCNPYDTDAPTGLIECGANAALIASATTMLEALHYAAELIHTARKHFPKSVQHADRFQLENVCATIGKAIAQAEGGAQ